MPSPTEDDQHELAELVAEARRRASDMTARRRRHRTALRRAALARVVRWQWATEESQLHRLEPLVREREDLRSRKLLDEPPDDQHVEEYGYDANGRIVIARDAHNPGRRSRYREELISHHERRVDSWTYWSDGEPLWASIFENDEEGRLRHVVQADTDGSLHTETYIWDGNRVKEVHRANDSRVHRLRTREVEEVRRGRPPRRDLLHMAERGRFAGPPRILAVAIGRPIASDARASRR